MVVAVVVALCPSIFYACNCRSIPIEITQLLSLGPMSIQALCVDGHQ